MRSRKIAVLGAGNMGTAVAQVLAKLGHRVCLWDYNPRTIVIIARTRKNEQFLPGVKLSKNIVAEASMERAVENAALVIVACASPYIRATARHLAHCLSAQNIIVAHVAKGLEQKTNRTMHEVIQSELPPALRRSIVTISGPSIAKEMVASVPTAVVAASQDKKAAALVQEIFNSNTFKVVPSVDWKGVSICGALKNVYAIALGMCDGMRLTMNAKAFMFSVAVREMENVVQALGGKRETVHGLAGIGDLVVTGLGQGRNRALGERICKEGHCKFIWDKNAQTHEGVAATKVFYNLAQRNKINAPLIKMVHGVLCKGADPCKAVQAFFRSVKR